MEVAGLDHLGLPLADGPVRAPVLLQHILRHVLSTEPKQRVGYFKALLSLTDLDKFRERVKAARGRLESEQIGPALLKVAALSDTPAAAASTSITALTKKPITADAARTAVSKALLEAGTTVLAGASSNSDPTFDTVENLQVAVAAALEVQLEKAFPLSAFASTPLTMDPLTSPDLSAYTAALAEADQHAARLAPVFDALLTVDEYAGLNVPTQCPVCGTDDALTPARIALLRDHLLRTQTLRDAAKAVAGALAAARQKLDQLATAVTRTVPPAATWSEDQLADATAALRELGVDTALFNTTRDRVYRVVTAADSLKAATAEARTRIEEAIDAVGARRTPADVLAAQFQLVSAATETLTDTVVDYTANTAALRRAVEDATRDRISVSGLSELNDVLSLRTEIVSEVVAEATRQRAIKRLNAADAELRAAVGAVLDDRFAQMSDTISKWWATIRPRELVGFGGIKRRAGGALFVNLIASLRVEPTGTPVEREALGVYSDSQLNALGLSIFLARNELLGAPVVMLDDPIPGSDADHRLTFVQNTLAELLGGGIQVLLTTFDSKLAEWASISHGGSEGIAYRLDLIDVKAGTEPTQTTDVFGQLMLEAEESLHAPTAKGRRSACNTLRSATERLAKQIIATGQTHAGTQTTVADIKAKTLGDLTPLVLPLVLDGNAEKGQWKLFAKVLNPGSHDDDVPSTTDLKQIFSNLRKIAKNHQNHWPGGLLQ
ncbi:hypothetical protein A5687_20630 [Mycobacterium mantenii]|nr:hypothetical protein A5687_20630 [Mycobacterium mantenii]